MELTEEVRALALDWNRFIRHLAVTKKTWDEMREKILERGTAEVCCNQPKMEQYLSMFGRVEWVKMIPDFVIYLRQYHGDDLNELLVEVPKKEKGKEEESDG